jgi:hypothetical protein
VASRRPRVPSQALGIIGGPWKRDRPQPRPSTPPAGRSSSTSCCGAKIVRHHPEIAAHRADALRTVSEPDHVAPDPSSRLRRRYYARDVGPSRWLLVVVSYETSPARIISVFANRKDPKSWTG